MTIVGASHLRRIVRATDKRLNHLYCLPSIPAERYPEQCQLTLLVLSLRRLQASRRLLLYRKLGSLSASLPIAQSGRVLLIPEGSAFSRRKPAVIAESRKSSGRDLTIS